MAPLLLLFLFVAIYSDALLASLLPVANSVDIALPLLTRLFLLSLATVDIRHIIAFIVMATRPSIASWLT